jgi:hypothetical protein
MITTRDAINLSKNKPVDEKKAENAAELAEARLAKLQWLEHPQTKLLIANLKFIETTIVQLASDAKASRQNELALDHLVALRMVKTIRLDIVNPDMIFGNAHTTNNQE